MWSCMGGCTKALDGIVNALLAAAIQDRQLGLAQASVLCTCNPQQSSISSSISVALSWAFTMGHSQWGVTMVNMPTSLEFTQNK